MSKVERTPALRRQHPASDLPARPPRPGSSRPEPTEQAIPTPATTTPGSAAAVASTTQVVTRPAEEPAGTDEKYSEQHNVRIRPSVKRRLERLAGKLQYEEGRPVSQASITDAAIDEYCQRHNI
ncbi:hypothetical protein ACN94_18165 [Gordonia paraffinivorans]|nr:hypothetical protein [Gordonia paraffinivorans]PWD41385.1 hypothetical protein ACN93_19750 [Gordonia paraffinivorans]